VECSIFESNLSELNMSSNTINPNLWVDKYSDYLFNYTIARVSDRELAQDLISETFLARTYLAYLHIKTEDY